MVYGTSRVMDSQALASECRETLQVVGVKFVQTACLDNQGWGKFPFKYLPHYDKMFSYANV